MKKAKPSVRQLIADAKAAGLSCTSKGVNTAALSGITSHSIRLEAVRVADVDWYGLPQEIWTDMPEVEWQAMVVAKARANAWETYHTLDSRGSDKGWCDVVMGRESQNTGAVWMYFCELKDADGKETKEQKRWAHLIAQLSCDRGKGSRVRNYLWRPAHWDVVQRILTEPME